jgi:tetratricopeptide (TPR) repeat protein
VCNYRQALRANKMGSVRAAAIVCLGLACVIVDGAFQPPLSLPVPTAGTVAVASRLASHVLNDPSVGAGGAGLLRLRGGSAEADAEKEVGNDAYKKKDFETAMKHYEAAAALDPTSMVYLNNIAATLMGMGKVDECLAKCRKAIEVLAVP